MKRWEKAMLKELEERRRAWQRFAETGYCEYIDCEGCVAQGMEICTDDEEMMKFLNEEVEYEVL